MPLALRLLVGANHVSVPTDRQPLADDPESDGQDKYVDGGKEAPGDRRCIDSDEARRQRADDLAPLGVPERERVLDGAGCRVWQ